MIGRVKAPRKTEEKSGIYRIDCHDCDTYYVGQTIRRLGERIREHSWACISQRVDRSAVAIHCQENGHQKGGYEILCKKC